jgi:hypothetical protein
LITDNQALTLAAFLRGVNREVNIPKTLVLDEWPAGARIRVSVGHVHIKTDLEDLELMCSADRSRVEEVGRHYGREMRARIEELHRGH